MTATMYAVQGVGVLEMSVKDELLKQVLSLPVEERFDLMMALLDSLSDDDLPVLEDFRIAHLEMLVAEYRDYPEPSVNYDKVLKRLRSAHRTPAG
jgi:hypothetical protein